MQILFGDLSFLFTYCATLSKLVKFLEPIFLLKLKKTLMSLCVHAQLCLTLQPIVCSLLGSSAHGIFWARILEWDDIS